MNTDDAYTIISDRFLEEWELVSAASFGLAVECRFAKVPEAGIPSADFVRFAFVPVLERQASFRDGANGQRYRNDGVIVIQIMALSDATAYRRARQMAVLAQRLFRGKVYGGCITFNNVRVNDVAPEDKFQRLNVVADYTFDEVG